MAFEQKTIVEDEVTGLRVKGQKSIEWYRTFAAYLNLPGYGIVGYNESITKTKKAGRKYTFFKKYFECNYQQQHRQYNVC